MQVSIFRRYKIYKEVYMNQLSYKLLNLRFKLIKYLVGNTKVVMNITVTSDIVDYNKLTSPSSIFYGNLVKTVSSRQSFVYNPSNTVYTR